ncbi:MAG: ACP S-malonyltransferase [Parachlamydiaceae bacterium]|nr:ACP S-malonyltransferase [Parachlamydiaceae bacterium]
MTAYIFPGQGSQSKGMGEGLFKEFPEITTQADSILGFSIEKLCLEDTQQQLNQTQYTQPALFTVGVLSYLKKIKESGKTPNYVAGHSLGEYNALFAAGVFNFETGLKLVKKRGELMSQIQGGGMAAIVGLGEDVVTSLLKNSGLQNVFIANFNSYSQFVISGEMNQVASAQKIFEDAGASLVVPLKVSGAFHSPFMNVAEKQFDLYLQNSIFLPPSIPVYSNFSANLYDATSVQKNLSHQISHPVKWTQIIKQLLNKSIDNFEEVGPGKVLTGLVRRIKNGQ